MSLILKEVHSLAPNHIFGELKNRGLVAVDQLGAPIGIPIPRTVNYLNLPVKEARAYRVNDQLVIRLTPKPSWLWGPNPEMFVYPEVLGPLMDDVIATISSAVIYEIQERLRTSSIERIRLGMELIPATFFNSLQLLPNQLAWLRHLRSQPRSSVILKGRGDYKDIQIDP